MIEMLSRAGSEAVRFHNLAHQFCTTCADSHSFSNDLLPPWLFLEVEKEPRLKAAWTFCLSSNLSIIKDMTKQNKIEKWEVGRKSYISGYSIHCFNWASFVQALSWDRKGSDILHKAENDNMLWTSSYSMLRLPWM